MIDFNVREYLRIPLPEGRYTFRIKNSGLKTSRSGDQMANIQLEVVSPLRRGQSIFKDFNIYHPGETAQRIAREELATLCAAVGIEDLKNLNQLDNKIVDAEVVVEKYIDKNGEEKSIVKVKRFSETRGEKIVDIQAPDVEFDDEVPF